MRATVWCVLVALSGCGLFDDDDFGGVDAGPTCATTGCGAGEVCSGGVCLAGCRIGSYYYAPGDTSGPCLSCDPTVSTTEWTPRPATTVCRTAFDACDVEETCDPGGFCPSDQRASAGTVCRAARGPCDAEETCNGFDASCPFDQHAFGVCRPRAGSCDVEESCNGVSDDCPADVLVADDTSCDGGGLCSAGVCEMAASCAELYARGYAWDAVYTIDPDGAGPGGAVDVLCDQTHDGGGWTKLASAHYPSVFGATTWDGVNGPTDDDYSILALRDAFRVGTTYTFRLEVGDAIPAFGRSFYTIWQQQHDPFTESTDGADYLFLVGAQPTGCGGFDGLHAASTSYGYTSDADAADDPACASMQIVPHTLAPGAGGYLDSYDGEHLWQRLWVR